LSDLKRGRTYKLVKEGGGDGIPAHSRGGSREIVALSSPRPEPDGVKGDLCGGEKRGRLIYFEIMSAWGKMRGRALLHGGA